MGERQSQLGDDPRRSLRAVGRRRARSRRRGRSPRRSSARSRPAATARPNPSAGRPGDARADGGRGAAARSDGRAGSTRNGRRCAVSSIAVLNPPWMTAKVAGARGAGASRVCPWISSPSLRLRRRGRVDPRTSATAIIRRAGTSNAWPWQKLSTTRRNSAEPTPDPPTEDDGDLLLGRVPKL